MTWKMMLPAALLVAAAAMPMQAQASLTQDATAVTQPETAAPVPEAAAAGPTMQGAAVGVRVHDAAARQATGSLDGAVAQEARLGAGRNVALMVVGGAAVLTGLLIGGDAGTGIAIGGAVVGLYGLYLFVR